MLFRACHTAPGKYFTLKEIEVRRKYSDTAVICPAGGDSRGATPTPTDRPKSVKELA
jgi:hypothetical protein